VGPALAAHLAAIDGIDVVIAPASSAAAPTIEETDVGGGPGAEAAIQAITRFMRLLNYLGLPVLEIPAGQSRHGMPIGLQLIGGPFGDETAINSVAPSKPPRAIIAASRTFHDAAVEARDLRMRFTRRRTAHAVNGVDIL
jgi:hypothetical protein